jgi:hypothetical protein
VPDPVPSLVVGIQENQPLVLAGPPEALTGLVQYHNRGAVTVVLRDAGVRDPAGLLPLRSTRYPLHPRTLRPDQSGTLPLSVTLEPGTPPGEYHVELDLGGRTRPATLHVVAVVALSVVPASLVVANQVGIPQSRRVIVTNEGNVPFRLGDVGNVDLRDDLPLERAPRLGLVPLPDAEALDLDALVVAVLAVARDEAREVRSLRVRALGPDLELHPGETKAIDLEITLQAELPSGRRYRGHIPILTRDVTVFVVPSGGPLEHDAPPPAARVTKVPDKSPKKRGGTP